MDYGEIINDLRNCNEYFNRLLYRQIWSLKHRGFETNNNKEILTYYNNRRRQRWVNVGVTVRVE